MWNNHLWDNLLQTTLIGHYPIVTINVGIQYFFEVYFTMYKSCMLIYKKLGICLSKKLTFKDKPYISKSFYGCCQCYSKDRKTISHKNYWKYAPMIPKIWVENLCNTTWLFTITLILAVWEKHSIFIIQYFSDEVKSNSPVQMLLMILSLIVLRAHGALLDISVG